MSLLVRRIASFVAIVCCLTILAACGGFAGSGAKHMQPLSASVKSRLAAMGSSPAEPMMIRIFKETSELEVWKRTTGGTYKLFASYEICAWSGELGPKIREGDRQAPEGFYTITPGLMNPNSSYYLAFNTGYPNKFDRAYGRTGSELMVHGDCSSRGCFAMTDEQIAEIYALARESFNGGQTSFQLQIYPFRMTPANLARYADNANMAFWQNIKEGYDRFELTHQPPVWDVCGKKYVFNARASSGQPLEAAAACPALDTDTTLTAALMEKQQADAAQVAVEFANLQAQQERDAAAAAKAKAEADAAAAEQAVLRQRGQAIGDFLSNAAAAVGIGQGAQPQGVIDPSRVAPIPAPRIKRT